MKSVFSKAKFLVLLSSILLFGCQNYSDNSLGTDITLQVKCPANGCANQAPSTSELTIDWRGPQTQMAFPSHNSIQLGGNCHASTYHDNRIEVIIYNSARKPMNVQYLSPTGNDIKCHKGRYDVVIDATALPAGNYRARLEVVGYDISGVAYRGGVNSIEIPINRLTN